MEKQGSMVLTTIFPSHTVVVPHLGFYPRSDHSLFLLVEILHPLRRVLRAVSRNRVDVRAEAAGLLRILDSNRNGT